VSPAICSPVSSVTGVLSIPRTMTSSPSNNTCIVCRLCKYLPRQGDLASVVYWYHSLPTASFPMLQDRDYLEVIDLDCTPFQSLFD
jgi:hypothetical protein